MNILIVDDHPLSLKLLSLLVRALPDVTTTEFTDPAAALAWCAHAEVDLVLVDYLMPDIDGLEFILRFRALDGRGTVPVLMITGETEGAVRREALERGANDFLTKPVDKVEFTSRVRNALTLRRAEVHLASRAAWLADEVTKATAEIRAREREVIHRLSNAAEYRDPETGKHILRMAHYSRLIARVLGLSESEQALVLEAAPMHDVGKMGTPDHILLKPGRLTDDEMVIMRRHTDIGAAILGGSSSPLLQTAATIALTHHEKFDGTGYPRGLRGEAIPLHGRIVAVADVFDALTSVRPYKPAWPVERAIDTLRDGAGGHFDPDCVRAFLADEGSIHAIRAELADDT